MSQSSFCVHLINDTSFSEGNKAVWSIVSSEENYGFSIIDSGTSRTYYKVKLDSTIKRVELACPDTTDLSELTYHFLYITWTGNNNETITVIRKDTKSEVRENKVGEINQWCTEDQYPNVKAVYNFGVLKEVTWENLVDLKNNGNLYPGLSYKITNYTCKTIQTNTTAQSHVFDIIVQAISNNKLSEIAKAVKKENDQYFSSSLLETWKIMYCLENDETRYSWADETNGKGVIYWMRDEYGNEAPYDFKNIQFKRGDDWVYTFNCDYDSINYDGSILGICKENVIEPAFDNSYFLPDNTFLNNDEGKCWGNIIEKNSITNTFWNSCCYNKLENNCSYNAFGAGSMYNKLGKNCQYLAFTSDLKTNVEVLTGTKLTQSTVIEPPLDYTEGLFYYAGLNKMGELKVWAPTNSIM